MNEDIKIAFLCDGKACKNCDRPIIPCHHTTDIEHAVNFSKHEERYFYERISMIRPEGTFVSRIGMAATYEQLAEECSELAHACLKHARVLRGVNPTPNTTEKTIKDVNEELADVTLLYKDLGLYPSEQLMQDKYERFLSRWNEAHGQTN